MDQPKVTVYIPTYNRKGLLERAINSVIGQDYSNIEIIVVDDNSTDGTESFLEEKSKEVANLKFFVKKQNSGACASRNIAIENATGDFITGLDDDDYFLPNRISDFVHFWTEKEKETVFLYSSYTLKIGESHFTKRGLRKKKMDFDSLLKVNDVGSQVFIETEVLRERGFDERLPMWQDFKCWLDILSGGGIAQGINNYSYVVDISHAHERISMKRKDKLLIAEDIIKSSFQLDKYQRLYLENHKCNYGVGYKMNFKEVLSVLFRLDFDFFFKFRFIKQYIKTLNN
ncbi:glycosyltransferase involved in cell wall biosynthesis [Balneicella halophila]|uniref:Glycosyltransferase involved in cell wall biosynthesis n=1 Tax=Balneicella halophila TaxID=1537566 RepID=A0A7L4UNJ3_BALHA|nr:glycosyltransferase [Balneicella halophila]PVX50750.1 glycosyltransferase involved in cell wall biosynthesis [Balneicella halophila]